jgi:hypothetical protein
MAKTPQAQQPQSQQQPQQQPQPQYTYTYVDRPDVDEAFADSVNSLFFDGQTMRIEFCVGRHQETKDGKTTGVRYPSCRLAMTTQCSIDLINRLQQVAAALTKAGVLKQEPPAAPAA